MRNALALIVVLVLLGVLFVPGGGDESADLNLHYISLETLDPQMMQAAFDVRVGYAVFEGLCTFNPYTFTIEPGVAERWTQTADGLTYEFYLRPDAIWSDGSPLTAHDFVTAWRQGMMPDISPPYTEFFMHIAGARDFQQWCRQSLAHVTDARAEDRPRLARERATRSLAKFDELVAVEAMDDRTLWVQLDTPCSYFLDLVASWPFFPLPAHVTDKFTKLDKTTYMLRRDPQWVKPGSIVSNGPYRVARWRFKRDVLLEANEHYHAADRVKSRTVRLNWFADDNTAYNAYASGMLDVQIGATPVPYMAEIINAARNGERHDVHEATSFGTYYFAYNNRPTTPDGKVNPFADVRVRKAFSIVVDKRKLVENVTRLRQRTSGVFIPPGSIPGYESPLGQRCISDTDDPAERRAMLDEARQLLADAGYPGGRGFPPVTVGYNSGGGHELVTQSLAAMWNDALGVTCVLQTQEWKVYLAKRNEGAYMIARSGWFGDYGDPTTFLDLFRTGHGNNDFGFADEWYDDLLDAAARESDPAQRMAMLKRAEQYAIGERYAMLPLYQYKLVHLFDPQRVSGVTLHPRNLQFFHFIEAGR